MFGHTTNSLIPFSFTKAVFPNIYDDVGATSDVIFREVISVLFYNRRKSINKDSFKAYIDTEIRRLNAGENVSQDIGGLLHRCDEEDDDILITNYDADSMSELVKHADDIKSDDWTEIKKVRYFYQSDFDVLCFVNTNTRKTVVFMSYDPKEENKKYWNNYHAILTSIPVIMPWFFEEENAITENEKLLLGYLREGNPEKYHSWIRNFLKQKDVKELLANSIITNFGKNFIQSKIHNVETDISRYYSNIQDHHRCIEDCLRSINSLNTRLLGLKQKADNNEFDELAAYISHNNNIVLDDTTHEELTYYVLTEAEYFDPDVLRNIVDNPNSDIYLECRTSSEECDLRIFLEAVFIDQIVKVPTIAQYALNLCSGISAVSNFSLNGYSEYIPNPHIYVHACLGGYEQPINEAIMNENYIAAIEQTVASAKSINVGEMASFRYFVRYVMEHARDCTPFAISVENGDLMTFDEVVEYKKSKEESNEQTN